MTTPFSILIAEDDPVLAALGISDAHGRVKPTRQAKYGQVEEFVRLLDASLAEAMAQGQVRTPTPEEPLRIVDLGCGNAYLTFAAHRFLTAPVEQGGRALPVRMTGVDVKQQSADHNAEVAARLGIDADFVVGSIADARSFCAAFFEHYNHVHRHAGIALHTPASVHYGTAAEIRVQRGATLDAAYAANPTRFGHRRPQPPKLPTVAWINEPTPEALIKSA